MSKVDQQLYRLCVDADVRPRGRVARRRFTGVVAAVVVVGGIGASLLATGTSTTSAGDSASSAEIAAPPDIASGAAADGSASQAPQERLVIRTGAATVVVSDPRREASRIAHRVETLGGRIDARSESGSGEVVSVTQRNDDVTVTVVERLEKILAEADTSADPSRHRAGAEGAYRRRGHRRPPRLRHGALRPPVPPASLKHRSQ